MIDQDEEPKPDTSREREVQRSEKEFFDALVREAGEFDPFTARGWRTLARWFETLVPCAGKPLRLADVGCGTGSSRRVYGSNVVSYVGIDLSLEALRIARSSGTPGTCVQGSALSLPFREDSFDVVAFSSVLHHVSDRPEAVRQATRATRVGGWIFAFDPNLLHPAMALLRHPSSPLYTSAGVSPNERPLLPSELRRDFEEAGLVQVRQRAVADIPYRSVAVGPLNAFLGLYNTLDRLLAVSGLGRWIGPFVLTAGMKPPPPGRRSR